jgi:hypothetical protein
VQDREVIGKLVEEKAKKAKNEEKKSCGGT